MKNRTWVLPSAADVSSPGHPTLPPLIQRILWNRGLRSAKEMDTFLHPEYIQHSHQPELYLSMDRVVQRLVAAIKQQQKITIYGDYDADGITATAIMVETLEVLGAQVDWYLPERLSEGYGLNQLAVRQLAKQGTNVILAVDCGTTNVEEIALANSLQVDVIVLDHHQLPDVLPAAYAIINPGAAGQSYPFLHHSSGAIAFKVATALLAATQHGHMLNRVVPAGWEKWLLDLVAISTVADMMPLIGENRLLVTYGLTVLRKTRRPGLRALFSLIGSDLNQADEHTIGFQIAPRLNAAGRLRHPSTALRLLLTRDQTEARQLAAELEQVNSDRRQLTELAVAEAVEQIEAQGDQGAYVAYAPHWSPGILGLIAGRLVERVWRPVIVMTANGDDIVGSGRSVPGYNIMELMNAGRHHFRRFGGHPAACGFTLQSTASRIALGTWVKQYALQAFPDPPDQPLPIDVEASLSQLDSATIDHLQACAPFGVGNERPRFLLTDVMVERAWPAGAEQQHVRLVGRQDQDQGKFIGFRLGSHLDALSSGSRIDLVVEASWNIWNGQTQRQLKIIDLRPHAV